MNFSEEEREVYEDRLDWLRVASGSIQKAKAEGIEEGIEKGIHQVAKAMLKEGISVTQVSKITRLSEEEIKKIAQT